MKRLPIPNNKPDTDYRQLWRVVDGAVADAFKTHPNYSGKFPPRFMNHIRSSIVKRVVGSVHGYQAEKGRSDLGSAVDTEPASLLRGLQTRLGKVARKLAGKLHPASILFLRSPKHGSAAQ